jgi:hypothetical protein
MIRIMFPTALLLVWTALAFGSPPPHVTQSSIVRVVKQQIQAVYNEADAAATRKDAAGAAAHYGDQRLHDATIVGLSKLIARCESLEFTSQIMSVTMETSGNYAATVVVRQHFQAFMHPAGSQKIGLAASDAEIREYWVNDGGDWTVMRSRLLWIRRTFNSRPVTAW